MQKKFVANKALLINAQGKILLIRDSGAGDHANSKGEFDVPGGRMEANEHPLEGLSREVKEETGVDMDVAKAKPVHVDLWGVGGDVVNEPIVGMFYAIEIGTVDVQLSHEHTEVFWYDPRTPIPDPMKTAVRAAIDAYRRREGIVMADEAIKGREGFGFVQVFTGNGKGKTTASLGEALRATAAGKKVGIVFFDKGGAHYSERKLLDQLGITYVATGRDRIDPVTGRFDFSVNDEDRLQAQKGMEAVRHFLKNGFDLVIADEINSCVHLKMLDLEEVLSLINEKPQNTELVLTGRNAPDALIANAHLVTEMRLRKHYFYSGVPAREGLDY